MRDPYHPYGHPGQHWGMTSDIVMLIGRIDERTAMTADRVEETVERLDRIDSRLQDGDHRMNSIDARMASIEASQASSAALPGLEKVLKSSLTYLLVSVAVVILGWSEPVIKILDSAGKVLVALKGLAQ